MYSAKFLTALRKTPAIILLFAIALIIQGTTPRELLSTPAANQSATILPVQSGIRETPQVVPNATPGERLAEKPPVLSATPTPATSNNRVEVDPTASLIPPPVPTEPVPAPKALLFDETARAVRLKTANFQLSIEKAAWKLAITNEVGQTIWEEPAPSQGTQVTGELAAYGAPSFLLNKKLLPAAKAALYRGVGEQQWFSLTRVRAVNWQEPVLKLEMETNDPAERTAVVSFTVVSSGTLLFNLEISDLTGVVSVAASGAIAPDEHFLGLGQRQLRTDQRGQRAVNLVRGRLELDEIKGEGSYAPYPFVLSTRGYGLLAETQRRNIFDLAALRPDAGLIQVEAANLNLAFFVDQNPLNILEQYTARIGRPPLPPPWDFGVWKTSIGGQERVTAEARRLRAEQIPISVLLVYDAVDLESGTGWGTPVFKPIAPGPYPDIAALNRTLHGLGYKTLTYVQDAAQVEWARYREGVARGYFVRNRKGQPYVLPLSKHGISPIDFTNPAAVSWFQTGLKRALVDLDFDGALQDVGDLLPLDAVLANGQSGYDVANSYPVLYAKATYDAARQYKPEAVFLMRAGYLGAQQYQSATWEGDLISHWDWRAGLPSTVPAALNRSISGSPFIGTEIAGYLDVNISRSDYKELYLRWTQYGAFNPIMRDILGEQRSDAIYLWSDADTVANFKRYARLHTDLFPLFYTLAKEASETGRPIMRHPYLLYPTDPLSISQEREFLLGESLLVAPVVTLEDNVKPLYLPPGKWVDFWTGELIEGGREITAQAPLDTIPVYVKAGAIIPTLLEPIQTLASPNGSTPLDGGLRLKIYRHDSGPQSSNFNLYDGTTFHHERTGDTVEVAISGNKSRPYQIEIPATGKPIEVTALESTVAFDFKERVAGEKSSETGWHYDAGSGQIIANLAGSKIVLRFKFKPGN